jgi:hypothetical protein
MFAARALGVGSTSGAGSRIAERDQLPIRVGLPSSRSIAMAER